MHLQSSDHAAPGMSQVQHSIPAGEPRLGIIAKSLHQPLQPVENSRALADKKMRFKLQRKAQSILFNHQAENFQDQYRVCWCHRNMRDIDGRVGVIRKKTGDGARFSNLGTCGSVWHCPVCATKVAEARRNEANRGMVAWVKEKKGSVHLLTLTTPHTAEERLADNLAKFEEATLRFKNSKTYKRILLKYGSVGAITSREVTWGTNGWHPHIHMLVFAKPIVQGKEKTYLDKDEAALFDLKSAWMDALAKVGLIHLKKTSEDIGKIIDVWNHALDLRGGDKAAEYIAKFGRDERWGMSSEMTRFHAKVGIRKGAWMDDAHFTPFQILEWAANGDHDAAALFKEYAEAYHGKRMITWSPGLADRIGVDKKEKTNEELAELEANPLPEEQQVGTLSFFQYRDLLKHNMLGEFIEYVADCCYDPDTGQQDIDDYCRSIAESPGTHSSLMRKKRGFGGGYSLVGNT